MPTKVTIPGVGPVSFPDSMSDDEINTASKNLYESGGKSGTFSNVQSASSSTAPGPAPAPNLPPGYQAAGMPGTGLADAGLSTARTLLSDPNATTPGEVAAGFAPNAAALAASAVPGLGLPAGVLFRGLMGAGAEGYRNAANSLMGAPGAPKTGEEAAKRSLIAGGAQVAFEGAAIGATSAAAHVLFGANYLASSGAKAVSKMAKELEIHLTPAERTQGAIPRLLEYVGKSSPAGMITRPARVAAVTASLDTAVQDAVGILKSRVPAEMATDANVDRVLARLPMAQPARTTPEQSAEVVLGAIHGQPTTAEKSGQVVLDAITAGEKAHATEGSRMFEDMKNATGSAKLFDLTHVGETAIELDKQIKSVNMAAKNSAALSQSAQDLLRDAKRFVKPEVDLSQFLPAGYSPEDLPPDALAKIMQQAKQYAKATGQAPAGPIRFDAAQALKWEQTLKYYTQGSDPDAKYVASKLLGPTKEANQASATAAGIGDQYELANAYWGRGKQVFDANWISKVATKAPEEVATYVAGNSDRAEQVMRALNFKLTDPAASAVQADAKQQLQRHVLQNLVGDPKHPGAVDLLGLSDRLNAQKPVLDKIISDPEVVGRLHQMSEASRTLDASTKLFNEQQVALQRQRDAVVKLTVNPKTGQVDPEGVATMATRIDRARASLAKDANTPEARAAIADLKDLSDRFAQTADLRQATGRLSELIQGPGTPETPDYFGMGKRLKKNAEILSRVARTPESQAQVDRLMAIGDVAARVTDLKPGLESSLRTQNIAHSMVTGGMAFALGKSHGLTTAAAGVLADSSIVAIAHNKMATDLMVRGIRYAGTGDMGKAMTNIARAVDISSKALKFGSAREKQEFVKSTSEQPQPQ